jgi:multisubunit Na+/H+ antiporter MnhB subunit
MSHFGDWFNYEATLKILVFSMLAGAALPGLFALGIRLQAVGSGSAGADGTTSQKNPVLSGLAWVIYGLVVAVILIALLYISRDFIAHHTGYPFLGAKLK